MEIATYDCAHTLKSRDEAATLRTLNSFAVDVMSIPSVEDLFWYVAQNVVGRLNFVDCVIYEADHDRTELTQVAALGDKNPFGRNILNPLRIGFGHGITGRVAQSGKSIVVDEIAQDADYIFDTQEARSEICVPLIVRGRVVGVIDSEHPCPNAFGRAELDIFTTIAAMTSAKLELLAEAERSNERYRDLVASHAQLTQETTTRKTLETRLHEARKLEALGRLTGRFAHEFNNLLTVISGNRELLAPQVTQGDGAACLADARASADRGAKMIGDMLSFAQHNRLAPEHLDLNDLARTTRTWSRDVMGDRIDVELRLGDDLWDVHTDRRAATDALRHLVLNARDAMTEGGRILIVTENIQRTVGEAPPTAVGPVPGLYVRMTIEDSGTGIPPDRLGQIFDPFYTTKALGAGSGMGLSTIAGFMRQSGGAIEVTSELNKGSIFTLYFPASVGPIKSVDTSLTTTR